MNKNRYSSLFMASDPKRSGYITGKIGKGIFEKSKLSKEMLSLLWELADQVILSINNNYNDDDDDVLG